ncbi:hypothetical protein EYF80_043686 [Liparis tanakae]|uniref:Uncharacterized protein n=1 Tax=Liparis tanakae TaxID=230148 RepID=A0A4Z2FY05_9TELE|nr:hypothetical protein EYF80_043686 [Liparis tanakae]
MKKAQGQSPERYGIKANVGQGDIALDQKDLDEGILKVKGTPRDKSEEPIFDIIYLLAFLFLVTGAFAGTLIASRRDMGPYRQVLALYGERLARVKAARTCREIDPPVKMSPKYPLKCSIEGLIGILIEAPSFSLEAYIVSFLAHRLSFLPTVVPLGLDLLF